MSSFKWQRFIVICFLAIGLGAFGGFVYWVISDFPEVRSLESYTPLESSFIYSSDGHQLAEFYLERRNFIPHYKIPTIVKNAFIAIEDQRFYSHSGVDFIGILRALYRDLMAKSIVQGGSTITQQLAKMLFLRPEKNVARKIKEAIISAQIEKRYTKDEILGMYLNKAYFGARSYGIEAAAQTYFGKPVSDLSLAEAAMLAGLQRAPATYSPFRNSEKTSMRRQLVLKKMLENGFISMNQYQHANEEPLPLAPHHRKYEAPYFIEVLRQQLEARYGDKLYTSGLKIYSTIDYSMQHAAEDAVRNGIKLIEKRVKPDVQAALVAIDPWDGSIKAMVGGNDFWETQFNRATLALRQPGSAFKPFVYTAALEGGMLPEDKILDGPVVFPGPTRNSTWAPKNYDHHYHGLVPLKTALALSLNTATVRLADRVGIAKIIGLAKRCGIKSTLEPYLPIALGASDVTLLDLTTAYGVFATGRKTEPLTYKRIMNRDGIPVEEVHPTSEEVLDQDTLGKIKELLRAVIETGTAVKAKAIGKMVYGKTGTTNNFSDAWFIGFDDNLVVGVWVGRDDHKPLGPKETGAQAALPLWMDFMAHTK
ncbi:MAG TPA: PBP1A family penicillin-binding protein [Dissulfurispiraceae bacterium]|nr:PBP1A family penicillin-binding protein [Dissulfurispiraceae bacterium]